jgi:hypothetical protein
VLLLPLSRRQALLVTWRRRIFPGTPELTQAVLASEVTPAAKGLSTRTAKVLETLHLPRVEPGW